MFSKVEVEEEEEEEEEEELPPRRPPRFDHDPLPGGHEKFLKKLL